MLSEDTNNTEQSANEHIEDTRLYNSNDYIFDIDKSLQYENRVSKDYGKILGNEEPKSLGEMAKIETKDILATSVGDIIGVGATFAISTAMYFTMGVFPESTGPLLQMIRSGVAPYWGEKVGELTTNIIKKVLKVDKDNSIKGENKEIKHRESFLKKASKAFLLPVKKITLENSINMTVGTIGAVTFFSLATLATATFPPTWALVLTSIAGMTGGYLGEKYVLLGVKKAYKEKLGIPKMVKKFSSLLNKDKKERRIEALTDFNIKKQTKEVTNEVTEIVKDLAEQDRGAELIELAVRGVFKLGRVGTIITGTSIGGFANLADDIIVPISVNGALLTIEEGKKVAGWMYNKIKNSISTETLFEQEETTIEPKRKISQELEDNNINKLHKSDSEITLVNVKMDEEWQEQPIEQKKYYEKEEKLLIDKKKINKLRKYNSVSRFIGKVKDKNKEYEKGNISGPNTMISRNLENKEDKDINVSTKL